MPGVIVVDVSAQPGGTQARVRSIVGDARFTTLPVHTVCLANGALHRAGSHAIADGSVTTLSRKRGDPRLLTDLRRIFRQRRPDVVDAHNVHSQFWAVIAGRLAGVPSLVCTVHSDYRQEHAQGRKGIWYCRVLRLANRLGASFVAVSPSVAQFLADLGIADNRIVVVPNAMPSDGQAGSRAAIRADLGLPDDAHVIVTVGRLEPVKNQSVLIEAITRLARRDQQRLLIVIGEGGQREALERLARDREVDDVVRFLGFRDDVPTLLSACDVFCLPSTSEGLPFAVLEAAAAELPLVLSPVGALPDLLGDTAAFVDPDDIEGWVRAIETCLSDRVAAQQSGLQSAERVRRLAGADEFVAAMRCLYDAPTSALDAHRGISPRKLAAPLVKSPLVQAGAVVASRVIPDAANQLLVLTYHRIWDDLDDPLLDPVLISATTAAFREQMQLLSRSFHPMTIDDVLAHLDSHEPLPRRAALVTFDDAYASFVDNAVPAIEAAHIPTVMFVPTAYPDRDDVDFWWDRLYRGLRRARRSTVSTPAGTFVLDGRRATAHRACARISNHVKRLPHPAAMDLVDEILASLGGEDPLPSVMSWDCLRTLPPLITLAPHSRTHAMLDRVDDVQLVGEVAGSLDDLRRMTGPCPPVFAYPAGQTSPEVEVSVADAGYRLAFTTVQGTNRLGRTQPLALRRVDVSRRHTLRTFEINLRAAGLLGAR